MIQQNLLSGAQPLQYPDKIVVDASNYSHIAPKSKADLLSVKNSIIRQISDHRERKFQRDRHAVKDL